MTEFSSSEKLKEVERELAQRRRVYPRLIDANKMSRATADRQTLILEAIRDDYRRKAEEERLPL
ncbi:hypothetical protein [Methylosinus sp. LW4]|uniref:hypothetical protein n=1 Tax=Methylosinus sp. LW4 TaxID=136993 RepID=UPI0003790D9F|nr:hypothetical protein [Methylosinus sp. LW4]